MDKSERSWEILEACVPRGTAEKLAHLLSISAEMVRRWRRAPENHENPYATGNFNPLDRVEAIQDHAFAHAPQEAHRIHLYFQRRYEQHASYTREHGPLSPAERDKEIADVVTEHAQLLNAVLSKLPADRVRKEWEDLKREGEELVSRIEAGGISDLTYQKVQKIRCK